MQLIVVMTAYFILGCVLPWIAPMLVGEQVGLAISLLLLGLTACIALAVRVRAYAVLGPGGALIGWTVANFGVLAVTLTLIARFEWEHSLVVAGTYAAILFLVVLGLTLVSRRGA
jgi:hypothetical protein